MVECTKEYAKSKLLRLGGGLMCIFYFLGIFNGLVMETLHEVSHMLAPKGHHHSYAFGHELPDYSSLEGMAGHSHKALEELKELLEANKQQKEDKKDADTEKLDKHFSGESKLMPATVLVENKQSNWCYIKRQHYRYIHISTPPPQRK